MEDNTITACPVFLLEERDLIAVSKPNFNSLLIDSPARILSL
jgi:hypothetical protein